MSMRPKYVFGSLETVFLFGGVVGFLICVLVLRPNAQNSKHILSHIPKEYILDATKQIAIEKRLGSISEKHLSKSTRFDVREVKP